MKTISDLIRELADIFPWVTPEIISKHLVTKHWKEKSGYVNAYNQLLRLEKQGEIIRSNNFDHIIYRKKGRDKRVGEQYFEHNQAVISILTKYHLLGYEVKYGGLKGSQTNSDGIIGGVAIELDRGNHTNNEDLENQIRKYSDEFEKVVFVSHTRTLKDDEDIKEKQFQAMKNLMERVKTLNLPKNLIKKLYFTTYIDLSNPSDTGKVCKNLKGKNFALW